MGRNTASSAVSAAALAAQHAMTAQAKIAVAAVEVSNFHGSWTFIMSCSLLGDQGDSDYYQGEALGPEMEESGQAAESQQQEK